MCPMTDERPEDQTRPLEEADSALEADLELHLTPGQSVDDLVPYPPATDVDEDR